MISLIFPGFFGFLRIGNRLDADDELSKNYNEFADMAEFYNSNACVASDGNDYYHTYACEDWDRQAFYIFNTAYAENELGLKPCPKCR